MPDPTPTPKPAVRPHGRPTVGASLLAATRAVLAQREAELLALKGLCSNRRCRLHYAHSGPCQKATS